MNQKAYITLQNSRINARSDLMNKNFCTLNDLRKLEVINICNGKKLGCISDIAFDLCSGCIQAIIVPRKIELNEFFSKKDKRNIKIPWYCVERIGDDIILVRFENQN
jgi:YlmC/YmxH family sporulation protein